MTDFQPGDQVRVVVDATIVQLASGGLGFEVNQPGASWHGSIREVEGVDIRPADSATWQEGIEIDRTDGRPILPISNGTFGQWAASSGFRDRNPVHRRQRVDLGPWEVASDASV